MLKSTILPFALPLALIWAAPGAAQDFADRPAETTTFGDVPAPANDQEVTFSAGQLDYQDDTQIVTATGDVKMVRAGNRLRADKVVWDQKSGRVTAQGNVSITAPSGETAYGDRIELTDTLRDGMVDNLLLVLSNGGRIAAERGNRVDGVTTLDHAAYTPCRVTGVDGCPKEPSFKVTAERIVHNPAKHRISYRNARLALFGRTVLWLPGLSHPDGSGGGSAGLLLPDFSFSRINGFEYAQPYYLKLAPNRDLTITPHVYSDVLPALGAQYRQLTGAGAFQVGGLITSGSRIPVNQPVGGEDRDRGIRGYFDANGAFQLSPDWALTASTRLTTDKTFLRRYDISRDDRLRSTANLERVTTNSYLSIAGWAVQSLRATDRGGQQPIALPAIDYRLRLADPIAGGQIELQANSLAIFRTAGQDTQRAFAKAEWNLRRITRWGQEVTLTGLVRGDVYHTDGALTSPTPYYAGTDGWHARGIAAAAVDIRWPFVGQALGGTQRIAPRFQLVATPPTKNLAIPNEDARAVDLEDSNLFALNRFPGYDRWDDGSRLTYGVDYALDLPGVAIRSVVGQSYRLANKELIFPDGTGLSDRLSDVVGRTTVRYGRYWALTHRFRLDKDNLAVRRNEIDATVGGKRTYGSIGYLRLNRDIDTGTEDLADREEIRVAGRVQIARYWSAFGSTVIDLTSAREDPVSTADGYEPVRHRLGFLYSDDCVDLGLTWRRDYDATRADTRRGNTFLLQVALRNLGR